MAFNLVLIRNTGFKLRNGFFQHLLVKLIAYFLDVARLLVAQQVTRAAKIEIMRR